MTLRTHVQKNGTIWEWEETKELKEWISLQIAKKAMTQHDGVLKELAD